jgi:hypothetical protein
LFARGDDGRYSFPAADDGLASPLLWIGAVQIIAAANSRDRGAKASQQQEDEYASGDRGSSGNFNGFFGSQGWSNTVSSTYGDLGAQFSPTVQAVGGYVGRIPNFTKQHPSQVVVELFNSSLTSLGTATINLPAAFNSPVNFGFRADEPIARCRMTSNNTGFFSVDNFTFGAVPEAASSTFMVVAIGALMTGRGRRRRITSCA